ncbi:MAG: hypothetical protein JOS17DRAFT_766098 [Linnemannia elongata]|nr:MAG: hypothetical protein JOS17DRAFT_766098 [Linnemannia elongata]
MKKKTWGRSSLLLLFFLCVSLEPSTCMSGPRPRKERGSRPPLHTLHGHTSFSSLTQLNPTCQKEEGSFYRCVFLFLLVQVIFCYVIPCHRVPPPPILNTHV